MFIRDVKDSDIIELYNLFKSCFRVDEIFLTSRYKVAIEDDKIPVYCSCWRVQSNPFINMIYVMNSLGFKEVVRNRLNYSQSYTKCEGCPNEVEGCFCCEDLWILQR